MSINGLFQTSRRSLRVLEGAIQTAGQNIANAGTPGYSRQRVALRADSVVAYGVHSGVRPGTFTGAGVSVQGYERLRDGLLDRAARDAHSDLGAADQEVRTGSALEGVFAVGTQGSLTESVAAFWDAWTDAANAPTDRSARGVMLDRADALAGVFRRHDEGLTRLADETRGALADGVDGFNAITERLAGLNEQIANARAAGAPDLGAEDERDQAVTELAALAPLGVAAETDGTYTITVQGMAVVQGAETTTVEHVGPPAEPDDAVRFAGTDVAFRPGAEGGGALGGWLRTLGQAVPETRAGLDALAAQITTDVNTAHAAGYGRDDVTGRDFFEPTGTTAATFARSAALTDPDHVALAGGAGDRGDASVALALADLRPGVERDAAAIAGGAGRRLQGASARADAASALTGHYEGLAAGVSGVSLDEEMTHLIEYQQAYAASARVLTTARDMFDTLLAL
ncbi:flagellar hook-associated protein FlgK [Rubrivirga sp. S365]|uniref:flagellar hook-associated protein FlgK n=1 Tax=Rubrivirga sp. S365 TaxID=3076080 RepID=UPI0028C59889|nr:flagellar hook-associated protein FlgK [Rubrivirga sp. S365]MDT7856060.1 flagellar hook-associated protein FlgK [Rubrivirga sp. S365]